MSERGYHCVRASLPAALPSQALRASSPKGGALPVILALRQTQLAVHDELCGGCDVGAAVGEGLGVVGRELAQHPVGQIVVRAGLCAHADADAGEVLAAEAGDDALEAVVAARRAGGPDAQFAGVLGDVVAEDDDMVGGILKKPASGAMESPERFI